MDRGWLEECLAAGMSLDAIGERAGKHPSTVSYWLKKHGLKAVGQARHAPKGSVDLNRLRELAESGISIRGMAVELGISYSTTDTGWAAAVSKRIMPSDVEKALLRGGRCLKRVSGVP